MSRLHNIAIDGPAASGKTTVARMLARRLGLIYLDTGAMYRAVTWKALQEGLDLGDHQALEATAVGLHLDMEPDPDSSAGHRLLVDGQDITVHLHSPEVSRAVPRVASVPGVRRDMVRRQREKAEQGGVIMVGRDIGTVVMPDARFKFYLDADLLERARRRRVDLEGEGRAFSHQEVARQLEERDNIDSTRNDSPLCVAQDARRLDCTTRTAEQVVEDIAALYQQERPGSGAGPRKEPT